VEQRSLPVPAKTLRSKRKKGNRPAAGGIVERGNGGGEVRKRKQRFQKMGVTQRSAEEHHKTTGRGGGQGERRKSKKKKRKKPKTDGKTTVLGGEGDRCQKTRGRAKIPANRQGKNFPRRKRRTSIGCGHSAGGGRGLKGRDCFSVYV